MIDIYHVHIKKLAFNQPDRKLASAKVNPHWGTIVISRTLWYFYDVGTDISGHITLMRVYAVMGTVLLSC